MTKSIVSAVCCTVVTIALIACGSGGSSSGNNSSSSGNNNSTTTTTASFVGSWGPGLSGGGSALTVRSLTFYPNGTYIQWQNGTEDQFTCLVPCTNVEYGLYSYDAVTSLLTVTSTVDQNSYVGFTAGSGQTVTIPAMVSGNTLSFSGRSLSRVVASNNPIGSWGLSPTNSGVSGSGPGEIVSLTLYPNGTYIHWQNGVLPPALCLLGCPAGVEYGYYDYNASSKELHARTTFDGNGETGLTNGSGTTATITVLSISLDIISFQSTTLYRVK